MAQLNWVDKTQPQTLMTATLLMYFNAVFGILYGLEFALFPIGAVLVLGQAAAGLGIANEKKLGYWFGVGLIAFWVAFIVLHFSVFGIINLMIYGALLALLLHPQSRGYRRIWFK